MLAAAAASSGLTWIDIGCGRGQVIRRVLELFEPERCVGVDVIDWLDDDLRDAVTMHVGPAEEILSDAKPADRVLLVETIEHLEAPWAVLRAAARLVNRGGRIVVSTPHIANLRHRLELLTRGVLTSFRPDDEPHLSPALPHVTARVLREEGLVVDPPIYTNRDVLPKLRGRHWPRSLHARWPSLSSSSVVIAAVRPVRSDG